LLAVGQGRCEVDERDVGIRGCAAGGRDRVGDPRPGAEVVEPRSADRSGDVDDELCHRGSAGVHRGPQWRDDDVRPSAMQRVHRQDGRDRNGEPSREHSTVLHAAIVAAEVLRQGVALHELVQLRRHRFPARAGDVQ
jgi:hypothetical protein